MERYLVIKISEYRKLKGITQKEFAKKLGISAGNLCEWEKGRIEPSINALIRISDLLDVSIDELVDKENFINSSCSGNNQKRLLSYFNLLDNEKQSLVLELLKNMAIK